MRFWFLDRRTTLSAAIVVVVVAVVLIVVFSTGGGLSSRGSGPSQSAAGTCATSGVTIERAGGAVTVSGTTYESISVTNRGDATCALPKVISARAYDGTTRQPVGEDAILRGSTAGTVELPAKGEAVVQFGVTAPSALSGCVAKSVDDVQFSLGDGAWVTVENPVLACTHEANLDVSPFSLVVPSPPAGSTTSTTVGTKIHH